MTVTVRRPAKWARAAQPKSLADEATDPERPLEGPITDVVGGDPLIGDSLVVLFQFGWL